MSILSKFSIFFFFLVGIVGATDLDFEPQESRPRPQPKWLKPLINQGEKNPQLEGYWTPPGIKLEIVASDSVRVNPKDDAVVVNPVGMTFDEFGRAYVLEWPAGGNFIPTKESFRYSDGSTRETEAFKKSNLDKVKLLSDTQGKGIYDKAVTIIEDHLPSSILVHENKIYLSGRGTVRRYGLDEKKKYAFEKNIAFGFCGFHHHQVSGLTIGNDGRLYLASGDNDNVVEGSDGTRADIYRTGGIFRSKLDGSGMETFALGFRNPYRDVAFDLNQNMFHLDNDNEDGTKFTGCRLLHINEGSDYGWRLKEGHVCCVADHRRGAASGELPGKMPVLLKTGRGSPAGLLIYNDSQFPEKFQGLLFYPDVFRKNIRAYRVAPKGSTFEVVEEFEFLKTEDPLFRPNQMVVGPDGAIYIVDWRTNSGGAGALSGDGVNGRIYRMSWEGDGIDKAIPLRSMNSWNVARDSNSTLKKLIEGPDATVRERAKRELIKRKSKEDLVELLNSKNKNARIIALGGLQGLWSKEIESLFVNILKSNERDADVRRLTIEALALNGKKGDAELKKLLDFFLRDSDPKTARAAALAMARVAAPGSAELLAKRLRELTQSTDRNLVDGVIRALESLNAEGVQTILQSLKNSKREDLSFWVNAVASLRTKEGFRILPEALATVSFAPHQAMLLKSIGNYQYKPLPDATPLVANFFKSKKQSSLNVDLGAVEALLHLGDAKNPELEKLADRFLSNKNPQLLSQVLILIEEKGLSVLLPKVRNRLRTEETEVGQLAILKTLRFFRDPESLVFIAAMTAPDYGVAVRSEAFRTLISLDAKKAKEIAKQFLKDKLIELQVEAIVLLGNDRREAIQMAKSLLAKELPRESLPSVVAALKKHELDPEVKKVLFEVRKLGLSVLKTPQGVVDLKARTLAMGNPAVGREIYLNSQLVTCTQCHKMEGFGGNIGPDLTRLWDTQKFDKTLESIVHPSAEVKENYQTIEIKTLEETTFSGLRDFENDKEIRLKMATGEVKRFLKSEVDTIRPSKISVMPEDTLDHLSFEQVADLMAFLTNRKEQESIGRRALEFWTIGPFTDDEKVNHNLEKGPMNFNATLESETTKKQVAWKKVKTQPDGYLDLFRLFGKHNISAYAATSIESRVDQDATLFLGSDDGVKLWVNGELVHSNMVLRGASPDSDRVTVKLKKGNNFVLARIFNGEVAHGFFLRVDERSAGLRVAAPER